MSSSPTAQAATSQDDFSLDRVPDEARYGWWSVAVQRFGQLSALAQFFIAASIGIGMSFTDAMIAITIGAVVLEALTIFMGIMGQREGLSTTPLARWAGFGTIGSALVGLVMATSLVGWFAIQNSVFAEGLHRVFPAIPLAALCLGGGLLVTAIVVKGFRMMNLVAWIAVPAFLALCLWSVGLELHKHGIAQVFSAPPAGQPMSMAAATTIVAGGFIVGAIFTPDMARYNRTAMDVVKQTVVGVSLGEYFVGVIGVLLAHALKIATPADAGMVVSIIQSTSGVVGILVLVLSIVKINDWNLYPSALGVVNAVDAVFGRRLDRRHVAAWLGLFGSTLSALGVANHIQPFLIGLGVLCPPIAAIMIADYFICRSWRDELDASRAQGRLPEYSPMVVPAGMAAWVVGALGGWWASQNPTMLGGWLIPSLVSVAMAGLMHVALGKLGLARGIGLPRTTVPVQAPTA